jgi:hypothetical protein
MPRRRDAGQTRTKAPAALGYSTIKSPVKVQPFGISPQLHYERDITVLPQMQCRKHRPHGNSGSTAVRPLDP